MMNRTQNAKKGVISGIINNLLSLFLPFVNRTIILYILGVEYLGIGGLFSSLIQVLNISELGFGSALSFILYRPLAEEDTDKVCAILSFARKVFRIIGFVVLGIGFLFMPFLRHLVNGDLPSSLNLYILYSLFLLNSTISYFMYSYKRVLLSASQRYDVEMAIGSAILILQNVLQLVVLVLWKNYYLYVIVFLISSLISNIVCEIVTRKRYPQYFCRGTIDNKDIIQLKNTVKGVFVSKMGSVMFSSVNNIIISSFLGLVILGRYSNYYYISSCVVGFFAVVHNSIRPVLGNCFITETKRKMYYMLNNITFLYNWTAALCSCCMLCLYQDFIVLWAGQENMLPWHFAILMVISFFVGRICSIPAVFVEAAGLYNESKYVNFSAGLVNLILGVLLVKLAGLNGVLIAMIISNILVSQGGYAYVLFKRYFVDKTLAVSYLKDYIYNILYQTVLIVMVCLLMDRFFSDSFLMLIFKALVSASLFALGFSLFIFSHKSRYKNSFLVLRQFLVLKK